ncbi:hypothetical protein EW145_g5629 [Phellinidium pouzarii]|uniref:Vacuolar sorting protein Vps3844 C-terminal domain-containing protein n=1 Tax=Phellinidium pouzarii TaxID=167371 RepID=A0A4S4L0M5_9AGAM|nr:hypothetical protein EW145_g5629 [Phellinidium pouzarii]
MFTKPWILLLLAEVTLGIKVFLQPEPLAKPLSPMLMPSQARVIVSHHLGLDAFDSIQDLDESSAELISGDFVGEGVGNALLLTVSEDVARDVIPSSLKWSFALSNPPSVSSEISLIVSSYLRRAEHIYSNVFSASTASPQGTVPRLIDVFSASPSSATEAFLSETAQVISLIESDEIDTFGAFELSGVSQIANKYGRHSEQFELAAETTKAMLASAMANPKLSFVVLTYPDSRWKRQMQPPQSPLPPPVPSPQLPIGGVSTCHISADACANATNSCSGRGECTQASKAGKTCFMCACEATIDSNGRKNVWVGEACERKDVSAAFVLITGTVIAIVLVLIGSISLLYSVGDQTLPPTLTASASGHIKRD